MAKLTNLFFPQEAQDYLIENGYTRSAGVIFPVDGTHYFIRGSMAVIIYGDNAEFYFWANEGFQLFAKFHSIKEMDMEDWKMVFHVNDIVPLHFDLLQEILDAKSKIDTPVLHLIEKVEL